MSSLSTAQKLAKVVGAVLKSPLSILVWLIGIGVSIGLKSPLPLAAAAVMQPVLVWRTLQSEEALRKIFTVEDPKQEDISDQELETLLDRMDFETRQRIRYIVQLHREVLRETRSADGSDIAKEDLQRIAKQLGPLVRRAVALAQRKQELAKYLLGMDVKSLEAYVTNLQKKIAETTDPVTRQQYEQAMKARQAELGTYDSIRQAGLRIDSQLENVEATFASWKARVVRLKTAGISGDAALREGLMHELEGLNADIEVLDSSVMEALNAEHSAALRLGG